MTKSLPYILPLVAGFLLIVAFLVSERPQPVGASTYDATRIGTATTSSAVAVTSSTRVLATTTNALGTGTSYTRIFASICNPSTTLVYLNFDGDKAASLASGNFTTIIAAAAGYSACYEITDKALYQGSVTASSTNETSTTVYVKDYVQ